MLNKFRLHGLLVLGIMVALASCMTERNLPNHIYKHELQACKIAEDICPEIKDSISIYDSIIIYERYDTVTIPIFASPVTDSIILTDTLFINNDYAQSASWVDKGKIYSKLQTKRDSLFKVIKSKDSVIISHHYESEIRQLQCVEKDVKINKLEKKTKTYKIILWVLAAIIAGIIIINKIL
jgi:hypothetical protein